ncbi:MAG: hypothetical protein ABW073_06395 [Acidimicrobiia bacterium]
MSIDEGRRILGENAIECFRLDRDVLARIAERIGPRPDELLGEHAVRPELVDHFDARGGFRKPPLLFDDGAIDRHLADDISALMSTQ